MYGDELRALYWSNKARELRLSEQLMKSFGSKIFQSDYSCSGSICAVNFQSVGDIQEDELREFAKFDSNYSFIDRAVNDLGETTISGLYIATDDPSILSLAN